MAAPHVCGVAALVWASKPQLSASQVRAALRGSALDLGTPGRDNAFGYGLVQASQAINYIYDATKDNIAPKITSGPTGTAAKPAGNFTITWATDEASDTIVTFVSPNLTTYRDATLTKSHKMSFSGSKGTTYTYWVSSSDAAGNMVTAKATIKL
jgi:subtilisin family serine protease